MCGTARHGTCVRSYGKNGSYNGYVYANHTLDAIQAVCARAGPLPYKQANVPFKRCFCDEHAI